MIPKTKDYKSFTKAMTVAKDDILSIKRVGANMFTSLDEMRSQLQPLQIISHK